MNQRERKQAGLPYRVYFDGLLEEQAITKQKIYEFNQLPPDDTERQKELIGSSLGCVGKNPWIIPPFHCDYGYNIKIRDNFICNYNCVMLDVNTITIGDNVQIAPNVTLTTAGHPIHPVSRNSGYEYGIPIHIGNNVWIGCNVVVNPGITIGDNAVIGSGSIVVKDIPPNVVAAGNPCRVIREITDDDIRYYYKDRVFDVDDYTVFYLG